MDKLELIKRPVMKELAEFKMLFNASLSSSTPLLNEVLTYIKQRNGKMMRPILVLLMSKLYGQVTDTALHAALSLELLHTASLIHDDVVDESSRRRGQSSVNALYDNKVSVLVGDYMLATSLKHAALTRSIPQVELVATLGQHLSEGEVIQLANISNRHFSEEIYFDVIRKKTAALFTASARSGALSAQAGDAEIARAAQIGEYIGVAFQIKDDIFDYTAGDDLGKPTGNDMAEGKLTLPALHVLNTYPDDRLMQVALRIRRQEATGEEMTRFAADVKRLGGLTYAEDVMRQYRDRALNLLPDFTSDDIRTALTAYIDYVIEREK